MNLFKYHGTFLFTDLIFYAGFLASFIVSVSN